MKTARFALLLWSTLACADIAIAGPAKGRATPLTPEGSPGEWVMPEDYPIPALRFGMTGTTAFELGVDATGKPVSCEITESSGFDLLDQSACKALLAKARFSPARDRTGKARAGSYRNRVRWATPGAAAVISEIWTSMLLTVDQTGHPTSCKFVIIFPAAGDGLDGKPCGTREAIPFELGLAIRGSYSGPSAEIEMQNADIFTPELRDRLLAPRSGYQQRALNIYRFTVGTDGRIKTCNYVEQRGDAGLVTDYCREVQNATYDPPFSAFDKDGVATGWHIMRVLLKSAP
ncbi:energy transducer TonB [Rhizorhabdus sp. FW153]|uniref:energy transducer TonB n=1 Tax=Rhizorhabdus sp. FW153 TaxID=3400216 RepID=UPI003CED43D2